MSIPGLVLARIAVKAVDHALPAKPAEERVRSPLEQARDRLARAKQMAESLNAAETWGVPISLLAGGAVALGRR